MPRSIYLHTFKESSFLRGDAPLGFKKLVEKVLDYAEGTKTVPGEFKVRSLHTKLLCVLLR